MTASKFENQRNATLASDEVSGVHTPKVIVDGIVLSTGDIEIGAIEIKDSTTDNRVAVDASGRLSVDGSTVTQPISAVALPLPAGASTAANQATAISSLGNINTGIGLLAKLTDTQPVSLASVPLPTGASTAARQDTGNSSLASIDTKLTAPLTVTGPLTNTELRASPVPVSVAGVATAANQATEILSLANLDVALSTRLKPADTLAKVTTIDTITNPVTVTGPLTDAQLRATPVPVTGSFSASTAATATAVPPLYIEGSSANLSQNLGGELRVHADSEELILRCMADQAMLQQNIEIKQTALALERYASRQHGRNNYASEQYSF